MEVIRGIISENGKFKPQNEEHEYSVYASSMRQPSIEDLDLTLHQGEASVTLVYEVRSTDEIYGATVIIIGTVQPDEKFVPEGENDPASVWSNQEHWGQETPLSLFDMVGETLKLTYTSRGTGHIYGAALYNN